MPPVLEVPSILASITSHKLCFMDAVAAMPWTIVPFVLGMFILVESLTASGWMTEFAQAAGVVVGHNRRTGIVVSGSTYPWHTCSNITMYY